MGLTPRSFAITVLGIMTGLMLCVTVPMIVLFIIFWIAKQANESNQPWHEPPGQMVLLLASLFVPVLWSLLIFGLVIPLQARRPAWVGTAILTGLVTLLGIAPAYPVSEFQWGLHHYYDIHNTNPDLFEQLVPLVEAAKNSTDPYEKYKVINFINTAGEAEAVLYSLSRVLGGLGAVMKVLSYFIFITLIVVTLMSIGYWMMNRQKPGEVEEPGSLGITVGGRRFHMTWGREGQIALPTTSEDETPLIPTSPVVPNTAPGNEV